MKNVNAKKLGSIEVPVAPLNEQRRIVEKVDALFAHSKKAKASLDRIPALLEKLKKSILAAAFRGDLTKDWREANPDVEPADKLLDRIRTERRRRWEEAELAKMRAKGKEPKDERWKQKYKEPAGPTTAGLPRLPGGWAWATWEQLSERVTVGHVGSMKDEYVPSGVPFLRSQNVRENRFDPVGLCYVSPGFHLRLKKSELSPGDLLVVRSGNVGVTCVVPDYLTEANCSDLVIIQRPLGVLADYGALYMNSAAQAAVQAGAVGVALTHFNTRSVAALPVAVAPHREQQQIVQVAMSALSNLRGIADVVVKSETRRTRLDQAILAKAFRGELVPQDPADEPAAVLLERIRAEREAAGPTKKGRGRGRGRKTKTSPPSIVLKSEPTVRSKPATPHPTQPDLPFDEQFLDLGPREQAQAVATALFGAGPQSKGDAVRLAAEGLRKFGLSDHKRLRTGGKLHRALEKALNNGVRYGLLDRPTRGEVRAIRPDAKTWTETDWALVAAAVPPTGDLDAWVREAATWAAETCGLEFNRLRTGGQIDRGLRKAAERC